MAGLGWQHAPFDEASARGVARVERGRVSVSRQMGQAHTDFAEGVKVLPGMRRRLSGSPERLLSEAAGNRPAHPEAAGVM